MTLMLAAARNTVLGVQLAMGDKEPELNINFHGRQFTGATVGIVGMGRIGLTVAKRAQAFDCRVLYHNRSKRDDVGFEYFAKFCGVQKNNFKLFICINTKSESWMICYPSVISSVSSWH